MSNSMVLNTFGPVLKYRRVDDLKYHVYIYMSSIAMQNFGL